MRKLEYVQAPIWVQHCSSFMSLRVIVLKSLNFCMYSSQNSIYTITFVSQPIGRHRPFQISKICRSRLAWQPSDCGYFKHQCVTQGNSAHLRDFRMAQEEYGSTRRVLVGVHELFCLVFTSDTVQWVSIVLYVILRCLSFVFANLLRRNLKVFTTLHDLIFTYICENYL